MRFINLSFFSHKTNSFHFLVVYAVTFNVSNSSVTITGPWYGVSSRNMRYQDNASQRNLSDKLFHRNQHLNVSFWIWTFKKFNFSVLSNSFWTTNQVIQSRESFRSNNNLAEHSFSWKRSFVQRGGHWVLSEALNALTAMLAFWFLTSAIMARTALPGWDRRQLKCDKSHVFRRCVWRSPVEDRRVLNCGNQTEDG